MVTIILEWLITIASTVYGGAVLTFAVLLAFYPRLSGRPPVELTRVYRAVGPITGLALGTWVFALLGERVLRTGTVTWSWGTPAEQLDLAFWCAFGALWFSSFVLEIWTMDPLRAAVDDEANAVIDAEAFDAGLAKTRVHLAVQAALVIVVLSLAGAGVG